MAGKFLATEDDYWNAIQRLEALGAVQADTAEAEELIELLRAIEVWELAHPEGDNDNGPSRPPSL